MTSSRSPAEVVMPPEGPVVQPDREALADLMLPSDLALPGGLAPVAMSVVPIPFLVRIVQAGLIARDQLAGMV